MSIKKFLMVAESIYILKDKINVDETLDYYMKMDENMKVFKNNHENITLLIDYIYKLNSKSSISKENLITKINDCYENDKIKILKDSIIVKFALEVIKHYNINEKTDIYEIINREEYKPLFNDMLILIKHMVAIEDAFNDKNDYQNFMDILYEKL